MPPLCPARRWHRRCHPAQGHPSFVPTAGDGACPQHPPHAQGMASLGQWPPDPIPHLLPTPVLTGPRGPSGMSHAGTGATGPSNQDNVGLWGPAVWMLFTVGTISPLINGLLGWVFHSPSGSRSQPDVDHGCGRAENGLHSLPQGPEPLEGCSSPQHVVPGAQGKRGDLRSPSKSGFPDGSSAPPGRGGYPARIASSQRWWMCCSHHDTSFMNTSSSLSMEKEEADPAGKTHPKPPVFDALGGWGRGYGGSPKLGLCRKLMEGPPDRSRVPGPPGDSHVQPTHAMSKKKESTWFLPGESGTPATPYHLRKSLTRLHSLVIQRLAPRSVRYWISGVSILRHSFWCFLLIFFFKL